MDLFDKVDVVLVLNPSRQDPNFFYLSGLISSPFEGSTLLITKKSKALLVPMLDYNLAKDEADYKVIPFSTRDEFSNTLSALLKGRERVGINYTTVSVLALNSLKKVAKGVKFIDVSEELDEMRAVKRQDEIMKIRKSCSITSHVMREVPNFAREGMTERNIAAEIEKRMKDYGGDETAFTSIVASGKNSADPHYYAGNRKIHNGDLVIIDIGCRCANYCSDMTRTFIVGKPSEKQVRMHETCLTMQKKGIDLVKSGAKTAEIFNAVDKIGSTSGYGNMIHGLSHGIGIAIHESPSIGQNSKSVLKSGNVITIEPGIYLPSLGGIRIEDDFVVTKRGAVQLTNAPKELVRI